VRNPLVQRIVDAYENEAQQVAESVGLERESR